MIATDGQQVNALVIAGLGIIGLNLIIFNASLSTAMEMGLPSHGWIPPRLMLRALSVIVGFMWAGLAVFLLADAHRSPIWWIDIAAMILALGSEALLVGVRQSRAEIPRHTQSSRRPKRRG